MSEYFEDLARQCSFNFQRSYHDLPNIFHASLIPEVFEDLNLLKFNDKLAADLNLNSKAIFQFGSQLLGGQYKIQSPQKDARFPIALNYAGHQFGGFTLLGDGRALLLGTHQNELGDRFDIHLKGSGLTPFSRRGDGRAALSPMLREYLISEAMHAMNIPTTRSLAVYQTNELVPRQELEKGAVLARCSRSHIRVGTFELAASQGDVGSVVSLLNYCVTRFFPDLLNLQNEELIYGFFDKVCYEQSELIARWMNYGFIHGVMNTDNMSITGETLDYGPCAWLDRYNIKTVFSSIDHNGRYAYGQQIHIGAWNLARLAEALAVCIPQDHQEHFVDTINQRLDQFILQTKNSWIRLVGERLGILAQDQDSLKFTDQLLNIFQKTNTDYHHSFFHIWANALSRKNNSALNHFKPQEFWTTSLDQDLEFQSWSASWYENYVCKLSEDSMVETMLTYNPLYIPRNFLVEESLFKASKQDNFYAFDTLLANLQKPFASHPREIKPINAPPDSYIKHFKTYCGT